MSAGRERRLTGAHTAEPRPPGGGLHQAAFPRGLGTDSPARVSGSDTAVSTAVGGQAAASSPVFTRGRAVGAQRPGAPPGTPRDGCIEATSGRWRSGVCRGVVHTPEEGLDEGVTRSQADVGGMPVNPPVLRSATITRAQAGIGPCATREGDGVKAAARPRPRTSAHETARPTRGLRLPRVIGHGRGIQGPP